MTRYESRDGRLLLFRGDSRRLDPIATASVGVILTSPPYWVRGRGRASAERYVRELAVDFGPEWCRVLAPDGDLWIVTGDRHDGTEWIGMDGLLTEWLRRGGWRLQSKGFWAQTGSRERWDNRVNYLLRFRKAGSIVRQRGTALCWMLPLPRSHPESIWDAIPEPVVRTLLDLSKRRGPVLDPFAGAGTVGLVAARQGRAWIGVERDPRMAQITARRLRLTPSKGASTAPSEPPPRTGLRRQSRRSKRRLMRDRGRPV